MDGITIRVFESPDVLPVVEIWNRALQRDPIEIGRFTSWLMGDADYWPGEDSGMFVAECYGKPVGFIRTIIRRWPNDRVGTEPENGWIPAMSVDPDYQRKGIGSALVDMAIHYLKNKDRKHIWVCGNTGSAPGYIFPGVDKDTYAGAFELFKKAGFVVDHEPIAMSREVVDFDVEKYHADAWSVGSDIIVETLTPDRVQDYLDFSPKNFPATGTSSLATRSNQASSTRFSSLAGKTKSSDTASGKPNTSAPSASLPHPAETASGQNSSSNPSVASARPTAATSGSTGPMTAQHVSTAGST